MLICLWHGTYQFLSANINFHGSLTHVGGAAITTMAKTIIASSPFAAD